MPKAVKAKVVKEQIKISKYPDLAGKRNSRPFLEKHETSSVSPSASVFCS
jgi:ABC-type taurine transport system substrate-binding protein